MLSSKVLRTQPEYEVVVADRLRPDELRAAAGLAPEPDFYGVLRPREGAGRRPLKAIDAPTALLLLTLREPGPLPDFARRALGGEAEAALARWVADGVLEVEVEGTFLSGVRALEHLGAGRSAQAATALARLSLAALRSAARLDSAQVERLAFHLYAYGRLPATRTERSRSAGLPPVEEGERQRFDADWQLAELGGRWLRWRSRAAARAPAGGAAVYKLYLSPRPEDLDRCAATFAAAACAAGAFELKRGAGAGGLLRPDKLVAYFADAAPLAAVAERLLRRLHDSGPVRPQGVPFTGELVGEGLLSWGLDPPAEGAGDGWRSARGGGSSWRHWLVLELARALAAARREGEPPEGAVEFALARLRLAGVDPEAWVPGEAWRAAVSGAG